MKDAQIESITAQIKLLTDTGAQLSQSLANKENSGRGGRGNIGDKGSGGGSNGGGGSGGESREFRYTRNMGGYCWSCGHHPVNAKHDSSTCKFKKDGHQNAATATNRMGSNNFWPIANRVRPSQQEHVSYKGKTTPN